MQNPQYSNYTARLGTSYLVLNSKDRDAPLGRWISAGGGCEETGVEDIGVNITCGLLLHDSGGAFYATLR